MLTDLPNAYGRVFFSPPIVDHEDTWPAESGLVGSVHRNTRDPDPKPGRHYILVRFVTCCIDSRDQAGRSHLPRQCLTSLKQLTKPKPLFPARSRSRELDVAGAAAGLGPRARVTSRKSSEAASFP